LSENSSLQGFDLGSTKEEKNKGFYSNSGFNQALGLAPQLEEDSDNFEAKAFTEVSVRPFGKF
jgi:hypothetical protein